MTHRLRAQNASFRRSLFYGGALLLAFAANACGDDDDDDDAPAAGRGGSAGRAGSAGSGGTGGRDGVAGGGRTAGTGPGGAAGQGGVAGESGAGGSAGTETPVEGGAAGSGGAAGEGTVAGSGGAAGEGGSGGVDDTVATYRPKVLPFTAARAAGLEVPEGFALNVFATNLGNARMLAVHNGHVYVTRPEQGDVLQLTDTDADGEVDTQVTVAADLPMVHGIAFSGNRVFLATVKEVLAANVNVNTGAFSGVATLIDDLPDGGQHPRRTLGVGPDGRLYISVGSSCDACEETNPEHATLLSAPLNGASRTIVATGLRNTIGFGWHPETEVLWGMDHGSDFRGNDIPPEELNRIVSGANYGWPYCYGKRRIDPIIQDPPMTTKEEYCPTTEPSVLEVQAHGAPIGMAFYTGDSFPAEYSGDAFIAMRGSWNRFPPTGYNISRLEFDAAGEPLGFSEFVTGFLIQNGTAVFGRPAGVAIAADGALLFTDDVNGVLYRVSAE